MSALSTTPQTESRRREKVPRRAADSVVGDVGFEFDRLRGILGPTAFSVWVRLLFCRNRRGITHVRRRTLVERLDLTPQQVKRAIARLKAAGLVSDVIQIRAHLCSMVVWGDYRAGRCTVPQSLYTSIRALPMHGGARENAGKKPMARVAHSLTSIAAQPQTKRSNTAAISRQDDPPSHIKTTSHPTSSDPTKPSRIRILRADRGIQQSREHPESDLLGKRSDARPAEDFIPEENGSNFPPVTNEASVKPRYVPKQRGGTERSLRQDEPFCPDVISMHIPSIPSPPPFKPDASDATIARHLVQLYRGAHEKRCKEPCFALCGADLEKSAYYATLVRAGRMMRDLDIPPAAWIAFAIDVWASLAPGNAKRRMPFGFAFSSKFISERVGWFRSEQGRYMGRRRLFSPEFRFYAQHYDAALRRYLGGGMTWEQAAEIFPGGWQKHWKAVLKASDRQAEQIRDMVARGEFLW